MSTQTIQTIAADLTRRVGEWLSQQDEASAGLSEVRGRLEALRATIGAGATAGALRELAGAEKQIRASRQREAATVIATALRECGIRVEPGAPLKRVRRATSKSSSTSVAEDGTVHRSTSSATTAEAPAAAPPELERNGWTGGRKAQ